MNSWLELLQQPWIARLGWTLVHFVWQGALLAAIFAVARHLLRTASANTRYLAGCVTLVAMLLAVGFTFCGQDRATEPAVPLRTPPTSSAPVHSPQDAANIVTVSATRVATAESRATLLDALRQVPAELERALPWLVAAWVLGVLALSARLAIGWFKVRSLKTHAVECAGERWLEKLVSLKQRLGISRPVRLVQSWAIEVPTIIGWLKPVILFPVAMFSGLSPAQVESILAHELAHIRRHDYLINLLQCVLETLLFYHPAVWWAGRCVRQERENCCDDLAVQVCGDPLQYARALATLEELRTRPVALALAADGKPLLQRIQRLLGQIPRHDSRARTSGGLISLVLLLALSIALPLAHSQKAAQNSVKSATLAVEVNSSTNIPPLASRSYKFNPQSLLPKEAWKSTNALTPDLINSEMQSLITSNLFGMLRKEYGVDVSAPGRTFFIKPHRGILMVRGLPSELEQVEKCMKKLDAIFPASAFPSYPQFLAKMDKMVLEALGYDGLPLSEVLKQLERETKRLDPEGKGIQFFIEPASTILPELGIPASQDLNLAATMIRIQPHLKSISLTTALNAIVSGADNPLQYRIDDKGIHFSERGEPSPLPRKTFRMDPNTFIGGLQRMAQWSLKSKAGDRTRSTEIENAFRTLALRESGVSLANPGHKVFFNEKLGVLWVQATREELDAIEGLVQKLEEAPPQVMIEVKVAELGEDDGKTFKLEEALANEQFYHETSAHGFTSSMLLQRGRGDGTYEKTDIATNKNLPAPSLAIISDAQFRRVIRTLERRTGSDLMNLPKLTTLSGRKAQLKAVEVRHIVTELGIDGSPITEPIEFGPIIDVMALASPDLRNLHLNVTGTVKEFLGYDQQPGNAGPGPLFRQRQVSTPATVSDGQTLVLDAGTVLLEEPQKLPAGAIPGPLFQAEKKPSPRHLKRLLFFVTPTLIDPDGNRIHSK